MIHQDHDSIGAHRYEGKIYAAVHISGRRRFRQSQVGGCKRDSFFLQRKKKCMREKLFMPRLELSKVVSYSYAV